MTSLERFQQRLGRVLADLEDATLLRRMAFPKGIDLVSNDYLGLAEHPYIKDAIRVAVADLPAGSGGSRLLHGQHDAFARLEERLAQFCSTEAALLFSSGYAANMGLLQAVIGPDDLVLSDELNHASVIDGLRLTKTPTIVYRHQDLSALEAGLRTARKGTAVIVTESVFSMDGDLTPLEELVTLAERYDAVVIVDEAHATGLYGNTGSGRVEELRLRHRVLATVHTGGKALGSSGAWVAGSRNLCDVLVNRARSFVFSTAPMPVLAAALNAGLDRVAQEPHRRSEVHRKASLLRNWLKECDVRVGGDSPIVPIVAGANNSALALQSGLIAEGFDVRAIRPPTIPPGTARLRVTVRYPVSDDDLLRFAQATARLLHLRAA